MESIYRQIIDKVNQGESIAQWLPQEQLKSGSKKQIPGAWDGIMLYHMGKSPLDEKEVEDLLRGICRKTMSQEEIEEYVERNSALALLEPLQGAMLNLEDERSLGELIYFSAKVLEESEKEEMVKFALILLGQMELGNFLELKEKIRLFARTDLFSLYALLAMKSWESSDEEIFGALKFLQGWGKVHAIELLDNPTEEMKNWLFLYGCSGSDLCDYCALRIYQKAQVKQKSQRTLSHEEFEALDALTYRLMVEATQPGITALEEEEKSTFLADYFSQLNLHASSAKDYRTALYTWDYYKNHPSLGPKMEEVFSSPQCRFAAEEALKHQGDAALAKFLGLSYGDELLRHLKENFEKNYSLGTELLDGAQKVDETISIFVEQSQQAEMGHKVLSLIPALKSYPGKGKELLLLALGGEEDRYRYQALLTCKEWTKREDRILASFFPESFPMLCTLLKKELSPGEKNMVEELLFGSMEEEASKPQ